MAITRKLNVVQQRTVARGKQFNSSQEFKDSDLTYYSIAKSNGLLKYIFTAEQITPEYTPVELNKEFMSTTMASSLENLIDVYQSIPYKKGEHRKLAFHKVINDLQEILNKEY